MGYINITSSQYSKGLKEKVASALCGFYKSKREIHSDGYIDTNSTELCDFLKSKFKYYGWKKNHSQSPFDVYSIRGRLAIELKTSNSANVNIMNATLYSDKAKIKDVLSKKDLVNIDKSIHDEFMDVLLIFIKKDKISDTVSFLEGFRIVDGKVMGVDYEDFVGLKKLYSELNDPQIKNKLLDIVFRESVSRGDPNHFLNKYLNGGFDGVCSLNLRKLLFLSDSAYFGGVK